MDKLPGHVAIIMDGNGRWAQKRHLPRVVGHKKGVQTVQEIVRTASDAGIKVLTLYTFSTENWTRPRFEVDFLMRILERDLKKEIAELDKNKVKFKVIGRLEELPLSVVNILEEAADKTKENTGLLLNLAINYGGRQEIIDAVREIADNLKKGSFKIEDLDEKTFSRYLYTRDIPDPDLIIRTAGEKRLSNFLLWQSSYSELYVTETLWPDFGREEFLLILKDYGERERKFGAL